MMLWKIMTCLGTNMAYMTFERIDEIARLQRTERLLMEAISKAVAKKCEHTEWLRIQHARTKHILCQQLA